MIVSEFLSFAREKLRSVSSSPALDAELLCAAALHKSREFLVARPQYRLSLAQKQKAGVLLQQRMRGMPMAYLLGRQEFFGLNFFVDTHTLIPRPETEILVEKACELLQNGGTLLDIGTGSGCIPISVAKNSAVEKIYASDICKNTLAIAKKNAEEHAVSIRFFISDMLKNIPQKVFINPKKPLVITANLPYVPQKETHTSVQHEPQTAIYSGEDGLDHYRIFFAALQKKSFDILLFEFHPPQVVFFAEYCQTHFPECNFSVLQDLAGRPRVGVLRKLCKTTKTV